MNPSFIIRIGRNVWSATEARIHNGKLLWLSSGGRQHSRKLSDLKGPVSIELV